MGRVVPVVFLLQRLLALQLGDGGLGLLHVCLLGPHLVQLGIQHLDLGLEADQQGRLTGQVHGAGRRGAWSGGRKADPGEGRIFRLQFAFLAVGGGDPGLHVLDPLVLGRELIEQQLLGLPQRIEPAADVAVFVELRVGHDGAGSGGGDGRAAAGSFLAMASRVAERSASSAWALKISCWICAISWV